MAFDPSILTPAGQPTYLAPEQIGMRQEEYQDIPVSQRPTQQWFVTPDGKQIAKRTDPRSGQTYYETARVGGKSISFRQDAQGQWMPKEEDAGSGGFFSGFVGDLKDNVLKDPRFMAFLAVAAGGMIASQYAGAGAAAGGTGGAAAGTAPAAAGTAPAAAGTTLPGGITATQAAGGVGAAAGANNILNSGTAGSYSDAGMPNYGGDLSGSPSNTAFGWENLPQETWTDIATRYGGNIVEWARNNPQLAAGIIGGIGGYAANSGDFTTTETTRTEIDPALAAYRDSVLGNLSTMTPNNVATYQPQRVGTANGNTATADYTGPTSYEAAINPLAGENNPYLTGVLDSARGDLQKYYDTMIAPKFASGSSFGSSGLGFAELLERDNQADQFSQLAGNLRFQDHALRANLLEQQAGRQDSANQFGMNFGRGLWQDQEGARQFDLNFGRNTFNDAEAARQQRMALALQGLNAPGSTTTTRSQTAQGNPWLGAMGGFLAGSNIWGSANPSSRTR